MISAAGCNLSGFAEGQVLEVLHEPGSGNIILQANFTSPNGETSLHQGLITVQTPSSSNQPVAVLQATSAAPGTSSDSDANPYKCTDCGGIFASKKTLRLHSTVHVDEAYYACEFCSATKIPWYEMYIHQCSNAENRAPIVCPQCFKTVATKKELQVHEDVHSLQRRFRSKKMDAYFERKLNAADETPVADWGAKAFICGVCGKPFGKIYEVEYHEKLHTGERQSGNTCDKCGINYLNRHDLNKHLALGCVGILTRKTN